MRFRGTKEQIKRTLKKDEEMRKKEIKKEVQKRYGEIARQGSSCCVQTHSCCGTQNMVEHVGKAIGYSDEEMKSIPEGANLGLGCGNPVALASLREGETVLDLGSGAGFDCFLAANRVGKKGKVVGVDMTPEMIEKAKENAKKGNYGNVEFKHGEIENLPLEDGSFDVIISNCVINLSPDKNKVFMEAFRILKPGGRLMISDIVLLRDLPESIKNSAEAYTGCIAGALRKDKYIATIKTAGFKKVEVLEEAIFSLDLGSEGSVAKAISEESKIPLEQLKELAQSVVSIKISAHKPKDASHERKEKASFI